MPLVILKYFSYLFLRGPIKLCKQIFRESGVRGFYHGLVPTFAREMPGYFFFFGTYELTRSLMTPEGKTKDDIGKNLILSVLSSLIATNFRLKLF